MTVHSVCEVFDKKISMGAAALTAYPAPRKCTSVRHLRLALWALPATSTVVPEIRKKKTNVVVIVCHSPVLSWGKGRTTRYM